MEHESVSAELDRLVEGCSKQTLGKPDYQLLQRACILSSLSLRVYGASATSIAQQGQRIDLTRMPNSASVHSLSYGLDEAPEATLLSGPVAGMPVHTIWMVKHVGVVVVYRGTDSVQDMLTDISCSPTKLAQTNMMLHGGIHEAAIQTMSNIQATYTHAAQAKCHQDPIPLFLTGNRSAFPTLLHCAGLW